VRNIGCIALLFTVTNVDESSAYELVQKIDSIQDRIYQNFGED